MGRPGTKMRARSIRKWIGIAGLFPGMALASVTGLPWSGFAGGGAGLTSFYVLGFELGAWQEYLAQELTPVYLLDEDHVPVRVSWLDEDWVMVLPAFADGLDDDPVFDVVLSYDLQDSVDAQYPGFVAGTEPNLFGFSRQLFSPGVSHRLSGGETLDVSAVLAYQRFGVANLGLQEATQWHWDATDPWYDPYQESGYGTGVRLALRSPLTEHLAIDAGYQSRIDMEAFGVYRGVYSQPADLDIPARAMVGLAWQAGDRSWLNFSIERVLYSDINAFPSRYLPDRFLSLLGDSTSPTFAWDDLTVYSVGWRWSDGSNTEWRLDFTSRSQPEPTSQVLTNALAGELASNAMVLGYSRRTGDRSRLDFNAAYAPAEYAFGGSVLGVTSESLDQDFELEALWIMDF